MTTNWQDPAGAPPQPPNGGQHHQNKGKRFAIVAILLVVIAGLGTAAGLVMVNRGSDDVADSPQYVVMDIADTTPVFEPRDAVGNDPFFHLELQKIAYQEEVEQQISEQVAIAQANAEPGETVVTPEFDVAALDEAVKTGLYGGTEENTCDPERLISFLFANPDIGEQWAFIQNIHFDEIPEYIRSLEVRVLAEPVNVLNHGYDSSVGAAYEIDSVLDAGTAVLVDENGDVRTRCYCGNPIKPKPPEHMPPRCLVFGSLVYTEPGGSTKRDDAARDVLLTGRQATVNGGTWTEVKWGTGDNQVGWTQNYNLRKHYCPTPTSDRFCPGPGATKVWHTPDMTTQVGQVTGKVFTHDTTLDIFAPINPVGGIGNETIVNDFMLIRFTEPANSVQNSAWVKLADLNQDNSECKRIRQCVETDGHIYDRANGGAIVSPEGKQWVEFTGHFTGDPLVTFAEVRVNDGTGNYGWMSNFYTPLPDEDCDQVYDCIEEAVLWESSDTNNPLEAKGTLINMDVTIIGGPQDGRVEVHVDPPTGPTGWVDTNAFYDGGGNCDHPPFCGNTSAVAWTEFPTNGVARPADATPVMIAGNGAVVFDGGVPYVWVDIDGTDYWIDFLGVNWLPPEDCIPETDCPMTLRGPLDRITPTLREIETLDERTESREMMPEDERLGYLDRCCVDALYNSTNVGDPSADAVPRWVSVVGSSEVATVTWFESPGPRYFREADIVDPSECEQSECPEPTRIPGREDILRRLGEVDLILDTGRILDTSAFEREIQPGFPDPTVPTPVDKECCVSQLFTAQGLGMLPMPDGPVWVEIASGPHDVAPSWYETTVGEWFPDTAVVNGEQCERDVDCPTDDGPGPDPRDEILRERYPKLDDDSSDTLILAVTLDRLGGVPGIECCVQGNVYDDIDGALKGTLDAPSDVLLITSSDDGTWHQIIVIDGGPPDNGWVMTDQFLSLNDCLRVMKCVGSPTVGASQSEGTYEECCAEIQTDDGIDFVTLTGETREGDDGIEYLTTDGEWVTVLAFLPQAACEPEGGNCPEFSVIDVVALAAGEIEICCAAIGNGFEAVGLTGESRLDDDGNVELERNDGTWIPIDDFVGADRCLPEVECPTFSVLTLNAPLECCVSLGGGEFETVTLTGQQREGDDGTEYEAEDGKWYLFPDDFASAGRCTPNETPCNGTVLSVGCCERPNEVFNGQCVPPCSTGQVRNANGVCVTPEVACPAGEIRNDAGACVPSSCQDTDDDEVCDSDDNCVFNSNRDQADSDQDGSGDKCDPCTDADGDLFCETPGDPANDNCWGNWNPDQSDVDGDGVGVPCDNCPNTPNRDQLNTDGIGTGDACENQCPIPSTGGDGDIDNDEVCDRDDNCIETPNADQADTFGVKGVGDACETRCPIEVTGAPGDIDGDGICNSDDNCVNTANPNQDNKDGDPFGDACDLCPFAAGTANIDTDGDRVGDECDICPTVANPDQSFPYDSYPFDGVKDSCVETFGITGGQGN